MKHKAGLLIATLLLVAGCGEGEGGGAGGRQLPAVTLAVRVVNVVNEPIAGAIVTVDSGGLQQQATTPASGIVSFAAVRTGLMTVSISADGFEPRAVTRALTNNDPHWDIELASTGAWSIGRAILLGAQTVDRADNGSAMTFSVDVAVIAGEDPEPVLTLTEADFRLYFIECNWGTPRECWEENSMPGSGNSYTAGPVQVFGLQPAPSRQQYVAGVLVERSGDGSEWDVKGPALGSYFRTLSGNDAVGLASVQVEDAMGTLTVLTPFTSDGGAFRDAIDWIASPAGNPPPMQTSLLESIRWTAAASASEFPGRDATLLVLSNNDFNSGFSIEYMNEAVTLAQQSGVHISTITVRGYSYSLPAMAVRTGGFVAEMDDIRQFGLAFGAMDEILAGTLPFYRMQFQLTGVAGSFVPGGNVKVFMHIDMPASIPNEGIYTSINIPIPR